MSVLAPTPCDVENDPGYRLLKHHIIKVTGLAYYADKDAALAAQIRRRLTALQIADCRTYLGLLSGPHGDAETDALTASLTIGETYFFRHEEFFNALRDRVFPELIERNRQSRRLRIWSAGCAIGAEPYSLAILLKHHFQFELAGWEVSIVATDINRDFLAEAERGEFSDWALRSMPAELKDACFVHKQPSWVIKNKYRHEVTFQYHNLVQHPFPCLATGFSAFDLILCRNVMIYFNPEVVRRLAGQFFDSLVEGGWFAVGPSEPSVSLFQTFQPINLPELVLYRKGSPLQEPGLPCWMNRATTAETSMGRLDAQPAPIAGISTSAPTPSIEHPHRTVAAGRAPRQATPAPRCILSDVRASLNRGQSDAAEECCRRLLTRERLNPVVHYYCGLVAEQQGRHAQSASALRRAIYLDRDFVLAHYYLGLVLASDHEGRAAERSFRNALALLRQRDDTETLDDADGLTVGALRQLTEMQLNILHRA